MKQPLPAHASPVGLGARISICFRTFFNTCFSSCFNNRYCTCAGTGFTARFTTRLSALVLTAGALLPASAGAVLKADPATSSVLVVLKQLNVPVQAKFNKFSAQIDYDAAHFKTARATVEIDVASFDLGDPDYNKEVLRREWFDAARFPKATFVSTAIAGNGAGRLTVSGKLTIKGKTADVSFPMTVTQQGNRQIFDGALPISRTLFKIGEGEWRDTSVVADEVVIRFHVVGS